VARTTAKSAGLNLQLLPRSASVRVFLTDYRCWSVY